MNKTNYVMGIPGLKDIQIDPSSYVDPNGFLFWYKNEVFRVVYTQAAEFYLSLFSSQVINKLTQNKSLVPTSIIPSTEFHIPEAGLILKHQVILPHTYCTEWCPSMLKDAALNILNLSEELLEHKCMLQDAYPWNVLFLGTKPIYVDFTSIVPWSEQLIWPAYEQFCSFFLRPLQLAVMRKGNISRNLLLNNISGISLNILLQNAVFSFKIRNLNLLIASHLDNFIQKRINLKAKLKNIIEDYTPQITPTIRKKFYNNLQQKIQSLSFLKSGDLWTNYYQTIPSFVDKNLKIEVVNSLLKKLNKRTLLDLGANTGVFSVNAANQGLKVIAVDQSEECMEKLYYFAKTQNLTVTPLISDILCPTPAFGFLGEQYLPLFNRIKSEIVLCLGLMHHLHIAGRQSFDRIAYLLARCTSDYLIFEFVDSSDANNELLDSRNVKDYTLETCLNSLTKYFKNFEIFDSDRKTRKIILATRLDLPAT